MSKTSRLTINDIARQAGVSKATVSRVLNNTGYVGEATRKKVEQVMRASQYSPSAMARGMLRQTTRTIGVVIPEVQNPFFWEVLSGLSDEAEQNGVTVIFCNTDNNRGKELAALRMLREQRVMGLVVTPAVDYAAQTREREFTQALQEVGVPVVFVDRWIGNPICDGVYFDNFTGAYIAAQRLIDEGHKKIGIITGDLNLILGRERLRGFVSALKDSGVPVEERYIFKGDFTAPTACRITADFLRQGQRPQAVFLCNNQTGIGFYQALFQARLRPGRDIACIGFDYIQSFDIFHIPYSYVDRDAVNMGRIAMRLLMERMEQKIEGRRVHIIPARLVLNGSERRKEKDDGQ